MLRLQNVPKPVRLPQKIFRIDTYLPRRTPFISSRKDVPLDPPVLEHSHDFFELLMVEQGAVHHWINGLEERLDRERLSSSALPTATRCNRCRVGARILNVMFRADTAAHLAERYGADVGGRFFWSKRALPMTLHLEGPQRERAVNSMLSLETSHRSLARIEHFLLSVMTHVLDTAAIVEDRAPAWLIRACRAAGSRGCSARAPKAS
jgi:AraC family cel operon transcriptional repressor